MAHHSLGLDYASITGNAQPDFVKLHGLGLRFAILRATFGTWADPTPARDRDAIRAAGVVYGAYLFPKIAAGGPSPADQVKTFAAAAQLKPGVDLAPVIDIEFAQPGIAATGMTRPQIGAWIGELIAAIRETFGVSPIVYSGARVLESADNDSLQGIADAVVKDCPLWLTRYLNSKVAEYDTAALDGIAAPAVPPFVDADGWWIHQYQGDATGLPTVKQVDLDRFNTATAATTGSRRAWLLARLGADAAATNDQLDAAIRTFQAAQQLAVDGVVGPATFAALSWRP